MMVHFQCKFLEEEYEIGRLVFEVCGECCSIEESEGKEGGCTVGLECMVGAVDWLCAGGERTTDVFV